MILFLFCVFGVTVYSVEISVVVKQNLKHFSHSLRENYQKNNSRWPLTEKDTISQYGVKVVLYGNFRFFYIKDLNV